MHLCRCTLQCSHSPAQPQLLPAGWTSSLTENLSAQLIHTSGLLGMGPGPLVASKTPSAAPSAERGRHWSIYTFHYCFLFLILSHTFQSAPHTLPIFLGQKQPALQPDLQVRQGCLWQQLAAVMRMGQEGSTNEAIQGIFFSWPNILQWELLFSHLGIRQGP